MILLGASRNQIRLFTVDPMVGYEIGQTQTEIFRIVNMLTAEPFTPSIAATPAGEKRVCFSHLDWASFKQISSALASQRVAHLTYDQGKLEITMPLEEHETASEWIALFIRHWVTIMGMKLKTIGSTTLERADQNRSAEPDKGFYIQNHSKVSGKRVDLATDPPPDLVVEIDITHTDIDKNRLYASLGIPEFWRYNGEQIRFYQLQGEGYQEVEISPTFPLMQKEDLYPFLSQCFQDEIAAEANLRQLINDRVHNG